MMRIRDRVRNAFTQSQEPGELMATVKGLVIKDVRMMVDSLRAYLIACAVYAVLPGAWIRMLGVCFVSMLPIITAELDMNSRWERFVLTLPVRRRDIVLSKYAFSFLGTLAMLMISLTLGEIGGVFSGLSMGRKELFLIAGISLVVQAVVLPYQFRSGLTQARVVFTVFYALIMIVFFAIDRSGAWSRFSRWIPPVWLLLIGSGIFAIYILSIGLSVHWYRKRSV